MSRKGQPSRPPSSCCVSRQKLHRLTNTATSARTQSVFSKNLPLPPIATAAPTATSLSPGSSTTVALATPSAETWSHEHCSSTLSPKVEDVAVSALAGSITVTSNNNESCILAACSREREHHRCVLIETPAVESSSRHGSRLNSAVANYQQRTESPSMIAGTLGGRPLSRVSGLAVELTKRQSSAKAVGNTAVAVTEFKPDCSFSSAKVMLEEEVIDLPLVLPGSAQLKVTDAVCQYDEISSGVKVCESRTQAVDNNESHMLASAAERDDASSSVAHALSDKTKNTNWWSKELISASSILGLSPSPSCRRRSGANSRTTRNFHHGLNAHEMHTVSNVLNTLARSQSRAAGTDATRVPSSAAGTSTAEPRVPTAERVRLTVSYNNIITTADSLAFL